MRTIGRSTIISSKTYTFGREKHDRSEPPSRLIMHSGHQRIYTSLTDVTADDPKLAAYGRASRLGLLPDHLREQAAKRLVSAARDELDASFFEQEDLLGLLSPVSLVSMGMDLRTKVLPSLEDRIDEIAADADIDDEPNSHFVKLLDLLDRVEAIGLDADADAFVKEARDQVRRSVEEIEERKRERDAEDNNDSDWTHIVTQKKEKAPVRPATMRSTLDDIDKWKRPGLMLVDTMQSA